MPTWRILTRRIQPLTSGAVAYQGPGDVVSGAAAWWGLRAYSMAAVGGNAIRIRRNSDNQEQDFVTLSDGSLDRASIVTFLNSTTGAITTFYDQTGNGVHQTQTTASKQPAVNLSGIGSFVTADFDGPVGGGGNARTMNFGGSFTLAQPLTYALMALRISDGNQQDIIGNGATNSVGYRFSAADQVFGYGGGTPITRTATDGVFHAVQFVSNGASSEINADGSGTTGNPGSSGYSAQDIWLGSSADTSGYFFGSFTEGGLWGVAFNGTQLTNMSDNMHSYWGF